MSRPTPEQRLTRAFTAIDRLVAEAFSERNLTMPSKPITDPRVAVVARILRENPGARGHQLVAQHLGLSESRVAEIASPSARSLALGSSQVRAGQLQHAANEAATQAAEADVNARLGGRSIRGLSASELANLTDELIPRR